MEKNNSRYVYLKLRVISGEYEHNHHGTIVLPDNATKTAERLVNEYAKGYSYGNAEKGINGYSFHAGCLFIKVTEWQFISQAHYETLSQYLP